MVPLMTGRKAGKVWGEGQDLGLDILSLNGYFNLLE